LALTAAVTPADTTGEGSETGFAIPRLPAMLLAGQEIRRAKLRFGLLTGAVGLLVFLILFQQALLGSLVTSFVGAIREQSGEVLVFDADARKNVAGSIVTPPEQEAVAGVAGIGAVAPLGESTFTVDTSEGDTDASIFGFTPGGPGEPTNVVEGRLPAAPGEAVASREDESAGFDVGAVVTTAAGDVPLTVVGLTERSRYSVAPTLWVTFDDFVELRRAANPDATGVLPSLLAVTPAAGSTADEVVAAINDRVDGVEALTRDQAAAEAPGVAQVDQSFSLILWLVRAVVLLVIGFFFVILTVQKLPSLTLVRAVGASTGYLMRGLAVQIALVLGLGLVIGVLLTLAAILAFPDGLPVTISPGEVAVNVALVVVFGALGSIVALVRIVRIDPNDAVRRPSLGGLT
jgi:putative ABC transport system permease protein